MTAQTQSTLRPAAVKAVLARSSTWIPATRRTDGRPFFIIAGSLPGTSYYTDETACTCPSARDMRRRSGPCKHVAAVREKANEESMAAGLATPAEVDCAFAGVAADARARDEALRRRPLLKTYEDLFGE